MAICNVCSSTLDDENSIEKCNVCFSCQSKYFGNLEKYNGTHLSIFLCCGAFNLPCIPSIVPIDIVNFQGDRWQKYIELLEDSGKLKTKKYQKGFLSGATNIREIFGTELSEHDFARYVKGEQAKFENQVGTPEQRDRWGTGELTKNTPFTDEIYDRLDELFEVKKDRYKGQTMTPQFVETITKICKWEALSERYIKQGYDSKAKRMQEMIQKEMESEQMRKKDEKPVENFDLQSQITAMELKGLVKDGVFMNFEATAKAIAENFIMKRKYDYSVDACDDVLFDAINTMRQNSDQPTLPYLPEELETNDVFGEFAEKPTDDEKNRRQYAGIISKNRSVKK